MPIELLAAGLLIGGLAVATPRGGARAQSPDVAQGHALAKQWCAACHQVEAGGAMNEIAPSFLTVANDPARTPEHLRTWLFSPHPDMPDFNLSYREIKSITAYLESLRK
jgi:mono/diheme cytochrome c family protein